MIKKVSKIFAVLGLLASMGALNLTAFAGASPNTGDRNVWLMGIVIAALILSAILLVVFVAMSAKGGKKKKRK